MQASFVSCELSGNGGSGLIALDGSVIGLESCTIARNKKSGLELRVRDRFPGATVSCLTDCRTVSLRHSA